MIGIYNAALVPVRALVEAWAAWQGLRPERRKEWAQRRGRGLPALSADTIWFHGASAGEARLASSLVRAYRRHDPDRPLAVSAITPAGRQLLPEPPEVVASFFAPLDFRAFHRRFFASGRPALLALLETPSSPSVPRFCRTFLENSIPPDRRPPQPPHASPRPLQPELEGGR